MTNTQVRFIIASIFALLIRTAAYSVPIPDTNPTTGVIAPRDPGDGKLNVGAIVGIVLGSLCGTVILVVAMCCCGGCAITKLGIKW
ncbi:hypothetical protein QBC42DRAFT_289147 [Cladorrhinum samala]|uniref:Uncharacterized protein n=1 Tax=Cladorrhinum samala TaxID=585594 RepID=A0AAV9HG78_9PEZI|nr:hypothetical protein QBC42DRAFT_289147 [Cladorrhinum samala]